ncbi:MAG: GNAT family N-acetyltransferase [Dehalococcoidia bacterium]|nr:GNAT family N-acetyltransferase [Dehalococcoidia bacterium]
MKPNIRPMTSGDKTVIMQILRNTPEFMAEEVVVAEEVMDSYLRDPSGPDYKILVAEVDSSVAGYICYGPTPLTKGTWDMYWAAVDPTKQGKGIGSALWAAAEKNMREANGRLSLIETSGKPSYAKTLRFHQKQGYHEVSRVPDFYDVGDDRLILRKLL